MAVGTYTWARRLIADSVEAFERLPEAGRAEYRAEFSLWEEATIADDLKLAAMNRA